MQMFPNINPYSGKLEKVKNLRNWMIDTATVLFDDDHNDLRSLPKTVRLQILVVFRTPLLRPLVTSQFRFWILPIQAILKILHNLLMALVDSQHWRIPMAWESFRLMVTVFSSLQLGENMAYPSSIFQTHQIQLWQVHC